MTRLGVYDHQQIVQIADPLKDSPKDAQTLARSTKINAQILYRLMRGLAWCGLVAHLADDRFSLTPLGECLQTESPDSLYENALSMGRLIGRHGVPYLMS